MTHPKADGLDALKAEIIAEYAGNFAEMDRAYPDGYPAAMCREMCKLSVTYLSQRGLLQGVPEGYVLVPMELSRNAAAEIEDEFGSDTNINTWLEWWQDVYRAMLAAAPKMEGME